MTPTAVDTLVSRLEQAAGSYPELWPLLTEAAALIRAKHDAQSLLAERDAARADLAACVPSLAHEETP